MKAKVYIGAKKYAVYIGRKIVEKTLEFLSLPAQFISSKVQVLKNLSLWGQSVQDGTPTPTTPIPIVSVGDKSKNLFDVNSPNKVNAYIYPPVLGRKISFGTSSASVTYKKIVYATQGTYTYTFDNCPITGTLSVCVCDDNETVLQFYTVPFYIGLNNIILDIEEEGWLYIQTIKDSTNIQFEEGTQATPYEPYGYKVPVTVGGATTNIYLNEPLRKVDEYADTLSVDGTTVTVTRNVASSTISNANPVSVRGNIANNRFVITGINANGLNNGHIICNLYKYGGLSFDQNDNFTIAGFSSSSDGRVCIRDNRYNTLNDFRNYIINSNIEIIVALATPTTETYTIDTPISAPQGTLTFDVDTVIKPTKTTITGDIDYVR